jgi:hypothetical protein
MWGRVATEWPAAAHRPPRYPAAAYELIALGAMMADMPKLA